MWQIAVLQTRSGGGVIEVKMRWLMGTLMVALPRPLVARHAISASDTAMTNAQAEVRKRRNERIKSRVQKVEVAKGAIWRTASPS
jgi:flagellar motor switch protein FliM